MLKKYFAGSLVTLLILISTAAGVCASTPRFGSVYSIQSALNSNYVLDVHNNGVKDESNIEIYQYHNASNQHFLIEKVDNTWFRLINMNANKVVDVNCGSNRDNIQICQKNGGSNQIFRLESAGNDYYYIKNKDGKYLDVDHGNCKNGTNVLAYSWNGGTNQKWRFVETSSSPYMTIPEGVYTFHSKLNNNLVLDVEGGRTADGTSIEIWSANGGNNQKFKVSRNGSYYKLTDTNSNKALDLNGNNVVNGEKIQIWPSHDGDAQKYRFKSTMTGEGSFFIEHRSGCVLDVFDASTRQGTRICLFVNHNGSNQKWTLEETTVNQPSNTLKYKALSQALYQNSRAYITCGFDGYSNTKGRHEGIDMKLGLGSGVYSLTEGTIINVVGGSRGSKGLSTVAIYNEADNKTVIYLHMQPTNLRIGQHIARGQFIGVEDWRGISSQGSCHTHVELRNGRRTLAAKSVGDYTLDNSNPNSYWRSKGYEIR